jgi:predicted AAA+ superfamily ATPase
MNIEREIKKDINTKLFKGKVIIIYGPRRVGKTTLAKEIVAPFGKDAKYFSCDDVSVRLALTNKNHNELKEFLGEGKIFVIDEAQRVYNIGLTLKIIITFPLKSLVFISFFISLSIFILCFISIKI